MVYEDDRFIIHYNKCDEEMILDMLDLIKDRMPRILSFFHINYDEKINIKFYDNVDEYKKNLEASFARIAEEESKKQNMLVQPRKYQDWMIANTEDGNVNMQSLYLVRSKKQFSNYTKKEFLLNSCHELTHLCQQKVGSNSPGWFWEVLATTLGNPECQHEIEGTFSVQDLDERFDLIDGYGAAFKIGKALFNTYDSDFILSLTQDNDKMYEVVGSIVSKINATYNNSGFNK